MVLMDPEPVNRHVPFPMIAPWIVAEPLTDSVVAGGSSPSTVTLYDLAGNKNLGSVQLSTDVRNTIHGLEVWPFD